MKRIVLALCVCASAAGVVAPASSAFTTSFDYVGTATGQEASSVGFYVERSPSGHKRVKQFTVAAIAYECRDAAPGMTSGWVLDRGMRIESRRFEGTGDWTGLPLDPVGTVSGKLRPAGAASGTFKIRGELAGPGTHCTTGSVDWKAKKNTLPF